MVAFKPILVCMILVFCHHVSSIAQESGATTDTMQPQNEESTAMMRTQGEIVGYQTLSVAGQAIAATFIEEKLGENHGAVILLPDAGQGIDGQGVITTLRHQLPLSGWSTLTLALDYPYQPNILLSPSVDEPSEIEETQQQTDNVVADQESSELPAISNQQRLEAALAYLNAKNIRRIVLLGHGQAGLIAVNLLDVIKTPMMGLILVATPSLENHDAFKPMKQPILDVYGDRDTTNVAEAALQRKLIMKRNNSTDYGERLIKGADHNFTGFESLLANSIRGWLKSYFVKKDKP